MSENTEAELEHFRQQWRKEVTARTKNKSEDQAYWQHKCRQRDKNEQERQQRSKIPDDVSKAPTNKPTGIAADSQVAKATTSPTTTASTGKVRKQHVGSSTASGGNFDDGVSELCTIGEDEATGGDTSYRGPSCKSGRISLAEKGPENTREPCSALEHYERAVEKECLGSLGESVNLYRKAFKLDDAVHEAYKNKHFPPPISTSEAIVKPASGTNPSQPNPSNASETVPNTAHHSLDGLSLSLSELLGAFAGLSIEGATMHADQKVSLQISSTTPKSPVSEPSLPLPTSSTSSATETSEKLPCLIATLPEELLVEILIQVAIQDVGDFARLALVCKRLAYVVMTEERVWKRAALGHEYGFSGMHYRYACDLNGKPLRYDYGDDENSQGGGRVLSDSNSMDGTSNSAIATSAMHKQRLDPATIFELSPAYPTYRQMIRLRPRIRFNGLYISTVNYSRPGAPSTSQLTWNSPVLIVTYYRYLRFYRDGTVISLLTVIDPSEVVPVFHRENIPANYHKHKLENRQNNHHSLRHHQKVHNTSQSNNSASMASAPASTPAHSSSSIMKDALQGRWHLSGFKSTLGQTDSDPNLDDSKDTNSDEGILHVETEGVIPKYTWNMRFALASAGRAGARNNKLTWIDYRCYNRLADDWGDFGLKNDRPFHWSRVRSYGSGL